MTDILPWLAANWLWLSVTVAVLTLLLACLPFLIGWYLRRLVIAAEPERPLRSGGHFVAPITDTHGDVPPVPEKAKGRAG